MASRRTIQFQQSFSNGAVIEKAPMIELVQKNPDSIMEVKKETLYSDGTQSLVVEIIIPPKPEQPKPEQSTKRKCNQKEKDHEDVLENDEGRRIPHHKDIHRQGCKSSCIKRS